MRSLAFPKETKYNNTKESIWCNIYVQKDIISSHSKSRLHSTGNSLITRIGRLDSLLKLWKRLLAESRSWCRKNRYFGYGRDIPLSEGHHRLLGVRILAPGCGSGEVTAEGQRVGSRGALQLDWEEYIYLRINWPLLWRDKHCLLNCVNST